MGTYVTGSAKHQSHHSEVSSANCTAATLLSHDSQDPGLLDTWCCSNPNACAPLSDTDSLTSFLPLLLKNQQARSPQDTRRLFISDIYTSPISTESSLDQPISFTHVFSEPLMDSDLGSEHSGQSQLNGFMSAPHDAFYRPQPDSPPLETPELVQRSLPKVCEQLSPTSSSLDSLELPPLSPLAAEGHDATSHLGCRPYPCGHSPDQLLPSKRQRCSDDTGTNANFLHATGMQLPEANVSAVPELPPLEMLSPDMPMTVWPTPSNLFRSYHPGQDDESQSAWDDISSTWAGSTSNSMFPTTTTTQSTSKVRGLSLDSAQLEDFSFMASTKSNLHLPMRARTTLLKPMPELQSLWEPDHGMDIDGPTPPHSPRATSLLLPFDGFDTEPSIDEDFGTCHNPSSSADMSAVLPGLFEEESTGFSPVRELAELDMDDIPSAPSSPRSPLMQLIPDDDMVEIPSDGTISPSLLVGPPSPADGLGLFIEPSGVDPPFARSPSPSDYELHVLEGQVDISATGLPEDEYQLLRTFYDSIAQAEASAKERESALDRRVKDISALLDPAKIVSDPSIMYTRRQELRTATEMRAEARRVRKREKHRLREIGAILDLKLDFDKSIFQRRGYMRSVPQLVANMVLKRRDTSRSLANRRAAYVGKSVTPSPLHTAISPTTEDFDRDEMDAE